MNAVCCLLFGPWPKKGTPLRFRAKKGHTGNEILESEKSTSRNIFECSTWVAHERLYVSGQKRVQFNTNRKKGYTSRYWAKKGHTAVNECCAKLKMPRISFFGPKPYGCALFSHPPSCFLTFCILSMY